MLDMEGCLKGFHAFHNITNAEADQYKASVDWCIKCGTIKIDISNRGHEHAQLRESLLFKSLKGSA